MLDEEFLPITPCNFFQISLGCLYVAPGELKQMGKSHQRYQLPNLSGLCADDYFADVFMGWNEEGLEFIFKIDKKVDQTSYPDVTQGDSVEVFIDTRDVKTSGYNTRFCHHFFFLPEAVEGHQKGEKTHFRTEDVHELCDPSVLSLTTAIKSKEYLLQIGIPKIALIGYDPVQFNRLGFTYRVNRPRLVSQHFAVTTEDYQLEQQPSLWSSAQLRNLA